MTDDQKESFALEMERFLGETDLGGRVSLYASSCLTSDYDIGVVNDHEDLHRKLIIYSGFGFFEQLLHKLVAKTKDAPEHKAIYRALLTKCVKSSILTHEGLASYVMWVSILRNRPEQEAAYLKNLSGVYRTAFDYATSLLPDPKRSAMTAAMYSCLNNHALYVGNLICTCPILEHFRDWRRIFDEPCRYLDFETIDEKFIAFSGAGNAFLQKTLPLFESAIPRVEELYKNTNLSTDDGVKKFLKVAGENEHAFYDKIATLLPEYRGCSFGYRENWSSYQQLLKGWQAEVARQKLHYMDDLAPYNVGASVDEGRLASRTSASLPIVPLCKRDIVQSKDAYDHLFRTMQDDSHKLVIFSLDELFESAKKGWVFDTQSNGFVEGQNGWKIQYDHDLLVYLPEVIDLGDQGGDARQYQLPYTKLRLNRALVTQCVGSLEKGRFRCFTNAEPYIALQLIHYQNNILDLGVTRILAKERHAAKYPNLFLPNLCLRAADCHELFSYVHTVQQDYRSSIGWTVIEGKNRLRVGIIQIADEMIYAFSDDGWGERFFIRKMIDQCGLAFNATGAEAFINDLLLAETFLSKSECNLNMINRVEPPWGIGGIST